MKWTIQYQVNCDGFDDNPDCHVTAEPAFDRKGAIERAKEDGWVIKSRKAWCPSCQAKAVDDN